MWNCGGSYCHYIGLFANYKHVYELKTGEIGTIWTNYLISSMTETSSDLIVGVLDQKVPLEEANIPI